jgi:hypothetical protein
MSSPGHGHVTRPSSEPPAVGSLANYLLPRHVRASDRCRPAPPRVPRRPAPTTLPVARRAMALAASSSRARVPTSTATPPGSASGPRRASTARRGCEEVVNGDGTRCGHDSHDLRTGSRLAVGQGTPSDDVGRSTVGPAARVVLVRTRAAGPPQSHDDSGPIASPQPAKASTHPDRRRSLPSHRSDRSPGGRLREGTGGVGGARHPSAA